MTGVPVQPPSENAAEQSADQAPADGGAAKPGEGSGPDAARSALARARESARDGGSRQGKPADASAPWRRRQQRVDPERRSGPGPDDRDPQEVGKLVDRLVGEREWANPLAIGTVIKVWPAVVGADVAAHTAPERLEAGELVVQADSTAWATQMRMLAAQVITRLDEEVGKGAVTQVSVLGPAAPSWKKGRRSVPGRGPRDTYG